MRYNVLHLVAEFVTNSSRYMSNTWEHCRDRRRCHCKMTKGSTHKVQSTQPAQKKQYRDPRARPRAPKPQGKKKPTLTSVPFSMTSVAKRPMRRLPCTVHFCVSALGPQLWLTNLRMLPFWLASITSPSPRSITNLCFSFAWRRACNKRRQESGRLYRGQNSSETL